MIWRPLPKLRRNKDDVVTVYLLHFTRPYRHAKHYIGVTGRVDEVEERIAEHRSGRGSNLCRHAVAAGSELILARLWERVPRTHEQRMKNRGGAKRLCPLCCPEGRFTSPRSGEMIAGGGPSA